MRSLLTAAALCVAAQVASAQSQCAPAAAPAQPVAQAGQAAPAGATPAHGELIRTAAAGTREPVRSAAAPREREGHPQRGGTAMLLAALALMSGIALRRYGGPRA